MSINGLNLETWQIVVLCAIAVWELAWKGIALWNAARNGQQMWFISLIVFNTAGILPIIYLLSSKKGK